MKKIIDLLSEEKLIGTQIKVQGWVRTKRESKNIAFLHINDGSSIQNLQVVLDAKIFGEKELQDANTGASVAIEGQLNASTGAGQQIELEATSLTILGKAKNYPLQPKKHSLEFLREIAHLRMRTTTFSAIARIRHQLTFAIHSYFHENGFLNIHTPILTATDAEGAGELFQVTTLDLTQIPTDAEGKVDYSQDFFAKPTSLAVSGQLEAELAALGLGKVYTFGPTFRAENSNTSRHLAEFWMIEPEMAFFNLEDNMNLAEDFLKFCIKSILAHCHEDLVFLEKRRIEEEKNKKAADRSPFPLIEKLKNVLDNSFERLSYSDAFLILKNSKPNKKNKFAFPIDNWGVDLQAEHERYLVEKHFKKPVILYDYPAKIKAFYMRMNEDKKTVAAMDILFPEIGEIIGGSQREERYDALERRIEDMHIDKNSLSWYLDTRRFGTVPHSGFGLGLERLMLFLTGMSNIRDVIPFPRTPSNIAF